MDDKRRILGLAVALALIAGAVLAIEQPWRQGSEVPPPPADLPDELAGLPGAPDFGGATGWIGTEPIDLVELRGSVVLVDFWTYSCINCIRTFPYLRAWHDTYADHGLTVVGVHTPEFRFERDAANVQDALDRYDLTHPVAQDNDYDIWKAYQNRFWPAKYLVDQYGKIRYTHFGEGAYEETEDRIRDLLAEAGYELPPRSDVTDQDHRRIDDLSPELYASAAQGRDRVSIGNPEGYHPGETITYARPADADIARDRIYLVGTWANHQEDVTAVGDDAAVLVRFRAVAANFVGHGPAGARVGVTLDGAPVPANATGADVRSDANGTYVVIDDPRNYKFYEGDGGTFLVELHVPDGFELYTFTFSATPNTE